MIAARRQQRGVALIVAVLAVALAVLLVAALVTRGETTRALQRDHWRAEQSWQLMLGLEAWAGDILLLDARGSGIDSLDEPWAQPMPPIAIPGARIGGRLRDLGGCFNVNALSPDGLTAPVAVARFTRLLHALQLNPALAAEAADFIDSDREPQPGGAEDAAYAQALPAYRTANRPLAHASELRRLRSMDAATWDVLAPYLCALPNDAAINLNTAPAPLWRTLDDAVTEDIARRLARSDGGSYATLDAVQAALAREGLPPLDLSGYALGSAYFVAEAEILADGIDFAYSSVLHRQPDRVRVLARVRGRL